MKMLIAVTASLIALSLTVPAAVAADGLPLPVENVGDTGVADAAGEFRYVTIKDGPNTIVERIEQDGGELSDSLRLDGLWTIPAVALDGSPGGLSADGSRLILIRPRSAFPRETTEFLRFETRDLRHPVAFTLDGDFSFDALSPDGRTMYLIHYLSRRDPTQYEVRAYDLRRERLVPGAITDPDESGEEMYGFALSRVTSEDGRWAYTLYWGSEHPFIHALDTVDGAADCIDLDDVVARDMYALTMRQDGSGDLVVEKRGTPVAVVDTETHGVSEPGPVEVAPDAEASQFPLVAVAAVAIGLALLAASLTLAARRRRRAVA